MCLLCALSYSLFYEKESAREKKSPMSRDVCAGKKHVSYGYVRLTRLIIGRSLSPVRLGQKCLCGTKGETRAFKNARIVILRLILLLILILPIDNTHLT